MPRVMKSTVFDSAGLPVLIPFVSVELGDVTYTGRFVPVTVRLDTVAVVHAVTELVAVR
jgi:hypothetical protein